LAPSWAQHVPSQVAEYDKLTVAASMQFKIDHHNTFHLSAMVLLRVSHDQASNGKNRPQPDLQPILRKRFYEPGSGFLAGFDHHATEFLAHIFVAAVWTLLEMALVLGQALDNIEMGSALLTMECIDHRSSPARLGGTDDEPHRPSCTLLSS